MTRGPSTPSTHSITLYPPIADACVIAGDEADTNFGGSFILLLSNRSYYITTDEIYQSYDPERIIGSSKIYLKFDLTSIPSNATIDVATLGMEYYCPFSPIERDVFVFYCSDDAWTESGITWNNAPSHEEIPTDTTHIKRTEEDWWGMGSCNWDVTQDVRRAIQKGMITLVLEADLSGIEENFYIDFSSKEKQVGVMNSLYVSYTS